MKIARLADGSPEIFHTLQGEGPTLGSPAIFLRLSLCNLHCQWCDTPYTWNWEKTPWTQQDGRKFKKSEQIIELDPEEVATAISRYSCDRLVLTGGEPLLQDKELAELSKLIPQIKHLEVETNGTRIPCKEFPIADTIFNVSPKLANSGMAEDLRINPEALRFFADHPHAIFKFVVNSKSDLDEIEDLKERFGFKSSRIFLMPEGRDHAILHERSLWLADLCRDLGYRFSPRLHVLLWGDQRAK